MKVELTRKGESELQFLSPFYVSNKDHVLKELSKKRTMDSEDLIDFLSAYTPTTGVARGVVTCLVTGGLVRRF